MNMRRIIYLVIPAILLPIIFIFDVIRATVELDVSSLSFIRELAIILSFTVIGLFIQQRRPNSRNTPKEIGRVLVALLSSLIIVGLVSWLQSSLHGTKSTASIRLATLLTLGNTFLAIVLGIVAMLVLLTIHDLILFKRRQTARRYYYGYFIVLLVSAGINIPSLQLGNNIIASLLFATAILMIIINSFRQNWIVFLSKREKIYSILYSVFLFIAFIVMDVYLVQHNGGKSTVAHYSQSLFTFIQLNMLLGTIYFGVTFVSALFHLPTAEVFERKQSELSSLHNLSRLVTEVFDFNDLVNTVTQMTTEVCGARSVWLELLTINEQTGELTIELAAKRNITQGEIDLLSTNEGLLIRRFVVDSHNVLLIEDIWADRRTKYLKEKGFARVSLLSVPLV